MRRPGFEPGSPAWQASIIPLDQRRLIDSKGNLIMSLQLKIMKIYFYQGAKKCNRLSLSKFTA